MTETRKEFNINKPTEFDGNRKDVQSFLQNCRVYLQVNKHVYTTDDSKVAFVLSFMNDKEAKRWKENYLIQITNVEGDLNFPTFKDFLAKINIDFKPANKGKDAAHQIAMLRQGKKTAEETVTEFRLLTNQAGYANDTPSDHLHLIEKMQTVLNPSLVKRVLLLDDVPNTVDKWAEKAIQIDSNYRQTMETLERLTGERRNPKASTPRASSSSSNNWRKKKEERDPDAMDIDAMSDSKRAYLMRKGACFICEETGHRAKDHDEHVKEQEKKKGKGKAPQKKDLRAIFNHFKTLTKSEKEELLAMTQTEPAKEEKKDDSDESDEDF
jgi:Retrotransposon gag protein